MQNLIKQNKLIQQIRDVGVNAGDVVVVHSSFRAIRPLEGGIQGLIKALQTVLGPQGTLVMPSMTSEDATPFLVTQTDCLELSAVADTFWRMPDVLRSNNPHAFAAWGRYAKEITAPHPIEIPHGIDSPIGRVYEYAGKILLLGVDHSVNTTIHLAESLAGVPYAQPKYVTILEDNHPLRIDYTETDHCCERFRLVGAWLAARNLQQTGVVGHGQAIVCQARDVIAVVCEQLQADPLIFLHARGHDEDCDAAWASMDHKKKS